MQHWPTQRTNQRRSQNIVAVGTFIPPPVRTPRRVPWPRCRMVLRSKHPFAASVRRRHGVRFLWSSEEKMVRVGGGAGVVGNGQGSGRNERVDRVAWPPAVAGRCCGPDAISAAAPNAANGAFAAVADNAAVRTSGAAAASDAATWSILRASLDAVAASNSCAPVPSDVGSDIPVLKHGASGDRRQHAVRT